MSWHTKMEFEPPRVAGCPVNPECRVADRRMVVKRDFFVLEVVHAQRPKRLQTLHHVGPGRFMVTGRTRVPPSRMK